MPCTFKRDSPAVGISHADSVENEGITNAGYERMLQAAGREELGGKTCRSYESNKNRYGGSSDEGKDVYLS